MKDFAKFHFQYTSLTLRYLRLLILIVLGAFSFAGLFNKSFPNFSVIPLSLFLMFEIFFKFKIAKMAPKSEVTINTADILDSFSLEILGIFEAKKTLSEIIKELIKFPQVKFIIAKADLKEAEIILIDAERSI